MLCQIKQLNLHTHEVYLPKQEDKLIPDTGATNEYRRWAFCNEKDQFSFQKKINWEKITCHKKKILKHKKKKPLWL